VVSLGFPTLSRRLSCPDMRSGDTGDRGHTVGAVAFRYAIGNLSGGPQRPGVPQAEPGSTVVVRHRQ
jgi:hypothetical protein